MFWSEGLIACFLSRPNRCNLTYTNVNVILFEISVQKDKCICWFCLQRKLFFSIGEANKWILYSSSITCSHSSFTLFSMWHPASSVTSVISYICLFLIIHTPSCCIKIAEITLFICTIIHTSTLFFSLAVIILNWLCLNMLETSVMMTQLYFK